MGKKRGFLRIFGEPPSAKGIFPLMAQSGGFEHFPYQLIRSLANAMKTMNQLINMKNVKIGMNTDANSNVGILW